MVLRVPSPYSETQADQTRALSDIGNWSVKFFEWFGNLALFCGRLIRSAVTPPYEIREFFRQFDELGSKSLALVALAGAATGIVPYALDSGQPDPLRSEVISSRRRHFFDDQGERSNYYGASG